MRTGKILLLQLAMILLGLLGVFFSRSEKKVYVFSDQKVLFSETDSFYEKTVEVKLSIENNLPGTIYYTLDGSMPNQESSIYEKAIAVEEKPGEIRVLTLRAMAVSPKGDKTEVSTHTYFVGENIRSRFDTLVCSVSSDPEGLYGYETGIFVEGRIREEYQNLHPGEELGAKFPANYNMRGKEAERAAYVEFLEPDGTLLAGQNAGIRNHGGTTRAAEQKSIKIFARSEYGKSSFDASLFPEEEALIDHPESQIYRRLLLRNNGNDFGGAYMRDVCVQELARQAGYEDTQAYRPAAVFLNGEYYGFEWLMELYDETYFHKKYGTDSYSGSWKVLELKDRPAEAEDESKLSVRAAEEWNAVAGLAGGDFNDPAVFEAFCEQVDLDSFLLYCEVEIYFSNPDWPVNNCKVYRWYSNDGTYGEGHTDGKWRFLLYDLDLAAGGSDDSYADDHSLAQVMNLEVDEWKRYFPLFTALMQRQDMRERFVSETESLMSGVFSEENVCRTADEIGELRWQELSLYMEKRAADGMADLREQQNILENSVQMFYDFARNRPAEMEKQFENFEN